MKNLRVGQQLSLPLTSLLLFNIITGITTSKGLNYYLLYIIFFLITAIPLSVIKKEIINKTSISWILFSISILTQYLADPDDLTGIAIFMFSLSISPKSKNYYVIYTAIFAPLWIYKSNLINVVPSQLMAYLCGIWFFSIIYKRFIHPQQEHEYTANYNNTVIKKLYIDIMTLYINGYSWSKISSELKLNVTGKSVQRTLDKEWKDRKFKNREQFAHYLGQMGIIKQIDKNLITE